MELHGSMCALVTPFARGQIDEVALGSLVDWQIAEGTTALVPVGTTGESATLSEEEHLRVTEIVVESAAGRVPVIAGVGCNATLRTVERARMAERTGVDALMVVAPYYSRPGRQGILEHFRAVHDATTKPIVIYNVPHRTAVDIDPEMVARLAQLERVAGLKDASGDISRVSDHVSLLGNRLALLSGDDATSLGFNVHGGQGAISVTANVVPGLCAAFQTATASGDFRLARALHDRLMPLHRALILNTGTAGAKCGLAMLGHCSSDVRLPLEPVTEDARRAIASAMASCEIPTPIGPFSTPETASCVA